MKTVPKHVKEVCCTASGYSWAEITGRRRHQSLVRVRQALLFFLRTHRNYRWSASEVGKAICRDHTTVLHLEQSAYLAVCGQYQTAQYPLTAKVYDALCEAEEYLNFMGRRMCGGAQEAVG